MITKRGTRSFVWPMLPALLCVGCEKRSAPAKLESSPPAASHPSPVGGEDGAEATLPTAQVENTLQPPASRRISEPPTAEPAKPTVAPTGARLLALPGILMDVPGTWVEKPINPGPMSPQAVYEIPNPSGEPASVRVTHFPGMKGMDEANIQRWLGQVQRSDGSPVTRSDAAITEIAVGDFKVTKVDVGGAIKPTMGAAARENQRMIAAIINHAQGPHFVVIVGGKDLMAARESEIGGLFQSLRPAP